MQRLHCGAPSSARLGLRSRRGRRSLDLGLAYAGAVRTADRGSPPGYADFSRYLGQADFSPQWSHARATDVARPQKPDKSGVIRGKPRGLRLLEEPPNGGRKDDQGRQGLFESVRSMILKGIRRAGVVSPRRRIDDREQVQQARVVHELMCEEVAGCGPDLIELGLAPEQITAATVVVFRPMGAGQGVVGGIQGQLGQVAAAALQRCGYQWP